MNLKVFFFSFTLILLSGCIKYNQTPVPNIPFDLTIDLNLPSYDALNGTGGWAYVNGGSRGIIVYRRSIDEFVAFDRHSPADEDGVCTQPLFPTEDNFLVLKDTCNNATFSLYDGMPINGSAFNLRQYQTNYNGSNLLRIFNQ